MSIEDIKVKIEEKLKFAPPLGATYKVDMGEDGTFFMDGTITPPKFNDKDSNIDADTTLILSSATMEGLVNGTQDPNMAFLMGKLKVQGSMGYALKLAGLLED